MKRFRWAIAPLLVFILLLSSCGLGRIRMGTADVGGRYYAFGEAFASVFKEKTGKEIEVHKTAGSAANLRLLSEGFLDIGIAQSDLIMDALEGTGSYAGKPLTGFSAVAGLYSEPCQIIVRADSGINEIDDLYGKAVSIGEEESGTESTALRILTAYGITDNKVRAYNLDYEKAAAYLEAKTIDAAFCTAGSAVESFAKLAEKVPLRLLSVDGREAVNLLRNFPCYAKAMIPENFYKGQEAAETISVRAVLLVSDKLDEATVKSLTEVLFANKIAFSLELSRELGIAFHKGANAYFEEAGLLPPDTSAKED